MERKKNSRQIPDQKSICADKRYYDILYGYLQSISQSEEIDGAIIRYVPYKDVKFSRLGIILNISRQTASTKMKNLENLGLIIKNDLKKRYELTVLDANAATLVPYPTLKLLVDALNENSISVYIYLLNRYIANEESPYVFTLAQVKAMIGISTTTRSNDEIITNILYVLSKIGLLKYKLTVVDQADNFDNIKTIYQIEWMTNELKC